MLRLAYQQGRFLPIMRCQNAIFRTRYATGQGLAPPAELPGHASQSKESGKDSYGTSSRSGRNEDRRGHDETNRFRYFASVQFTTVATAILGLAGDAAYKAWLDSQREKKMVTAFDKSPAPVDPKFVERPLVYQVVKEVITRNDYNYGLIVGNHGTGKSTIVKKIACETNGALYISIKSDPDSDRALSRAIITALGGLPPVTFLGSIWAKVVDDENPDHHIGTALEMFQCAAERFKAVHGRPAVLVLDDVNIIAQDNPGLLRVLQHHAKMAADNELFKLVFVCSDGVAPLQLSGKLSPVQSGECRIGDLTDSEAREYLTAKNQFSEDTAAKLVDFCGPRILHLRNNCNLLKAGMDIDALITSLRQQAWSKFYLASKAVNQDLAFAISRRIMGQGPLTTEQYFDACGSIDIGNQFLLLNVFAINSQGLYGFENKTTENAVRAHLAVRTGLWASLLRK